LETNASNPNLKKNNPVWKKEILKSTRSSLNRNQMAVEDIIDGTTCI